MLVIRLRRIGKKNKPSYRIVVAEHSFPVDGRFVADLGYYNPHTKENSLNKEKAIEWMKKGAKPSNTIAKVMEKEKVKHSSVVVTKKNKKSKKAEENPPTGGPAAPAQEAAPEAVETPSVEAAEEKTEAPAEEPKAEEPEVEEKEEEKKDS